MLTGAVTLMHVQNNTVRIPIPYIPRHIVVVQFVDETEFIFTMGADRVTPLLKRRIMARLVEEKGFRKRP
jgi:hypothetical protein